MTDPSTLTPEQIQKIKAQVDKITDGFKAAETAVEDFGQKAAEVMAKATKEAEGLNKNTVTYGQTMREIQYTMEAQERVHKNIITQLETQIKAVQERTIGEKKSKAEAKEFEKAKKKELVALEKQKRIQEDIYGIQKKRRDNEKEGVKNAEDFLSALGVVKKNQFGIFGILTKTTEQQAKFKKRITESVKSGEMLAGAMKKVAEGAMQLAVMGMKGGSLFGIDLPGIVGAIKESLVLPAELYRTYGDMERYKNMIVESRQELAIWGVTEKEAGMALAELASTIPEFNMASVSAQKEMLATSTALAKMGFDTKTTAKTQENLIKTLGMAPKEAAKYTKSLAGLSKQMKVGNKFFQDMQNSMEQLAAFTKDKAIKVFETMATRAHALGLALGQLWKISEGFETFANASQKVAEFNIALGGPYLNTLKMMKAAHNEPIKVIEQMQDAFAASGKSLSDMSPAMVKYMASTIGVSKVELKRIMGSKAALKEWAEQQKKSEERQKNLNEMVLKAQDIFMELSAVIREVFFSNGDFIESMKSAVRGLGDWIKNNKWLIETLISLFTPPGGFIVLAIAGIVKLGSVLFMLNLQMMATSGGTMGLGGALSSVFAGAGLGVTLAGIAAVAAAIGGIVLIGMTAISVISELMAAKTEKEKAAAGWGTAGAVIGGILGGVGGFMIGGPAGAVLGAGVGMGLGKSALQGAMVDDAEFGRGSVKAIVTKSGQVAIPSAMDTVTAAKQRAGSSARTDALLERLVTLTEKNLNKNTTMVVSGKVLGEIADSQRNKNATYGRPGTPIAV